MTDQQLEDFLAEKVMGWRLDNPFPENERSELFESWMESDYIAISRCAWHPLREISQAWQVLEKVTDPTGLGGLVFRELPHRTVPYVPVCSEVMSRFQKASLWACSSQEAATEICLIAAECLGVDAQEEE